MAFRAVEADSMNREPGGWLVRKWAAEGDDGRGV
jgi:hypothetical protein